LLLGRWGVSCFFAQELFPFFALQILAATKVMSKMTHTSFKERRNYGEFAVLYNVHLSMLF
jgi:hypothetical protein